MTIKYDQNKQRWSLFPTGTLSDVLDVLEAGAKKYAVDNWMTVDNARERYYNAGMRHFDAWWNGEIRDPETRLPHLAHATCCLLFLMWFDNNGYPKQEPKAE